MRPYIGVTGLTSAGQAETLIAGIRLPESHKIMIGVLASRKIPTSRQRRFPDLDTAGNIFSSDRRAFNVFHYGSKGHDGLLGQLNQLTEYGGELLHGIQLNVCWPDPKIIVGCRKHHRRKHRRRMKIILQIGDDALNDVGRDPRRLVERIREYGPIIDYALLDPSGGEGKLLDIGEIGSFVERINDDCPDLALGIAGGLSAETLQTIRPLLEQYPWLSIDAEGKLRNNADDLLVENAIDYVNAATGILNSQRCS